MMFDARKFNQESYDCYDKMIKDLWIDFIKSKGFTITKSEEDYEVDIKAEKNGFEYCFEVESKSTYPFYDEESFPFDSVSFAGRKKRLADKNSFWYVIINHKTETAIVCHSDVIFNDEYIETININTNQRQGLDQFYRVPKHKCRFIKINNQ
jgi:hypothetical protein